MEKILYNSTQVRKEIVNLFKSGGKRVAITAFVGNGADAYLPNPSGVDLVCWLKAGGTNPNELRNLIKKGVKIYHSDSVHMKVYWGENYGAIITSANLSTNALGSGNLKEIGILLKQKELDIDYLWKSINPIAVTGQDLYLLDDLHKEYSKRNPHIKNGERKTFVDWYESPYPEKWKLAWTEGETDLAQVAKEKAIQEYNVKEPHFWLGYDQENYALNDWILTFSLKRTPKDIKWMWPDFIVQVPKADKVDNCFQVIQLYTNTKYPQPPFDVSKKNFKKAFSEACKEYGIKKIKKMTDTTPPDELIKLINKHYK